MLSELAETLARLTAETGAIVWIECRPGEDALRLVFEWEYCEHIYRAAQFLPFIEIALAPEPEYLQFHVEAAKRKYKEATL